MLKGSSPTEPLTLSRPGLTIGGIPFENIGEIDGKTTKGRKSAAYGEGNVGLSRRRLSCDRTRGPGRIPRASRRAAFYCRFCAEGRPAFQARPRKRRKTHSAPRSGERGHAHFNRAKGWR